MGSERKERLDVWLVERGLAPSRDAARRLILAGKARVDDAPASKPGHRFPESARIETLEVSEPFVGRGGRKLQKALEAFDINPTGWTALDIGASTGGFTDCLLQGGAAKVYAVDVGHNQLRWELRNDPRVVCLEKTNARYLDASHVPEAVDLVVMDVSFISVSKLIEPVTARLKPGGRIVLLAKPQFEVGPDEVGKGGVVKDPVLHQRVVDDMKAMLEGLHFEVLGAIDSPITGADGNREFLVAGRKRPQAGSMAGAAPVME